jgi:hypothetical protein
MNRFAIIAALALAAACSNPPPTFCEERCAERDRACPLPDGALLCDTCADFDLLAEEADCLEEWDHVWLGCTTDQFCSASCPPGRVGNPSWFECASAYCATTPTAVGCNRL